MHALRGNPHNPVMEASLSILSYRWGNEASERIDNLLKATQLFKEQGQVSIPILLHLKELLIFRQIMPNSLVLRVPCLKTNKTVLVRSLGFGPERWCH